MPAPRDTTFIATIADREGWLFEHVVEGPTQAVAEQELREILRHCAMTLIEFRRAPAEERVPSPRKAGLRIMGIAIAATALVSAVARVIVL